MAASGAAQTFPIRAGEVKKGTHVLIKGFPCKVIEVSRLERACSAPHGRLRPLPADRCQLALAACTLCLVLCRSPPPR